MTKPKYTPGPWSNSGLNGTNYFIDTQDDRTGGLVSICQVPYDNGEDAVANARLIAAAPEMLAALKEVVAYYDTGRWPHEELPGYVILAITVIGSIEGDND